MRTIIATPDVLLHMGAGSRAADALERLINTALDSYAAEMEEMGNGDECAAELLARLLNERQN